MQQMLVHVFKYPKMNYIKNVILILKTTDF